MTIVSTIVGGGSISLGFGISGSFVELRDTIGGSRGGNMLVASATGIVGSESSESVVSIRISTIGIGVAIGTSVQVCGIGFSFSLRFGISGPLAVVVGITVSSVSVAVVSTIVSSVSKTVSISISVGMAVVSTPM